MLNARNQSMSGGRPTANMSGTPKGLNTALAPAAPMEPAVLQFLAFVLSRDGQSAVARQGVPLLDASLDRDGLA